MMCVQLLALKSSLLWTQWVEMAVFPSGITCDAEWEGSPKQVTL